MLRNLRDHQSSTAIKTKLLESRVEKEKRSEEIIHAQLLQASALRIEKLQQKKIEKYNKPNARRQIEATREKEALNRYNKEFRKNYRAEDYSNKEKTPNTSLATVAWDKELAKRQDNDKQKAALKEAQKARREMGINAKSPQNSQTEIQTPSVPLPAKAPYNVLTNCYGIEHKDCLHSREVSFNAHLRPKANIFNLPIMLNILQMIIFDWMMRQYKRTIYMLENAEKLLSKKDDIVYLLLQFWDMIKADPRKAINDKNVREVLDSRIANCHVLRKLWEENTYGAIQIEDPPESNKIMAGAYNWLLTLTDLINKVLTKRRFDFFTASPPLLLVEADTIIVSENTVQSARAWSNERSVRLITIDGSRELQEIIFTGRFVREIIYIVQADDQISAGIESTLRFFAENSLKFKTTLVLHEPEKYTDRLRMVEQFRNMAETYSTGFYTMRGRPGELAEIRHKINATPRFTTTESEELLDADVPSTSGFNTTEIEKIREKFKPTSTMVAEPIIINEKLAAHYRERNKSPPASYYKERAKEEERIRDLREQNGLKANTSFSS
uniref:Uncharacterized protein n=1 Tax=Meloidogyne floridensis TaxID=298350 RepID=A0A915NIL6_9BILA